MIRSPHSDPNPMMIRTVLVCLTLLTLTSQALAQEAVAQETLAQETSEQENEEPSFQLKPPALIDEDAESKPYAAPVDDANVDLEDPTPPRNKAGQYTSQFLLGTLGLLGGGLIGALPAFSGAEGLPALFVTIPICSGLLVATAVNAVGDNYGGQGSFGAAFLGQLVGGLVSGATFLIGATQDNEALITVGAVSFLVLPVLGAIVGYNISDNRAIEEERERKQQERQKAVEIVGAGFAPTADGNGFTVGLSGRF